MAARWLSACGSASRPAAPGTTKSPSSLVCSVVPSLSCACGASCDPEAGRGGTDAGVEVGTVLCGT